MIETVLFSIAQTLMLLVILAPVFYWLGRGADWLVDKAKIIDHGLLFAELMFWFAGPAMTIIIVVLAYEGHHVLRAVLR